MSDHSTQVVWHVAEQSLIVTLLSTKVLNSLKKMVAETSLSWSGTIRSSHYAPINAVCLTLHTWGRCWRKDGDLPSESSPRGWYLVRIVPIHSNRMHILFRCFKCLCEWGVAFDPSGNLHIANYSSPCVEVFTPDGKYVTQYGS